MPLWYPPFTIVVALENVVIPATLTLSKFVWPSTSKSPLTSKSPVTSTCPSAFILSLATLPFVVSSNDKLPDSALIL